jgi:hypothetical protein
MSDASASDERRVVCHGMAWTLAVALILVVVVTLVINKRAGIVVPGLFFAINRPVRDVIPKKASY